MRENPFRIGTHVTGAHFTDRAEEVARIREAMRDRSRLLVFGPRRMGKSSAVAVATEGARRDGVLVVRADLSTASSPVDVANRLLHTLSSQRKRTWLAELASQLTPMVSLSFDDATGMPRIAFGADRRSGPPEQQRRSLEQVIEALAREAEGSGRVAVVLDEFQAVRRFGGEDAEWRLRDLIQRHGELSFVCAGSEVSLIQEMIGPKRAFFRTFELLHMGSIDGGHLSRWIDSRMESAGVAAEGVGGAIIERAGPRTQDVLQVARHVHARGVAGGMVDTDHVDRALRDVVREEDPVIRSIWTELTPHQQNVLRAVASGAGRIFSTETRRRFGLPTSSTVASAVDALIGRGLLVRQPDDGAVVFDSPFVRLWVVWEVLQDVPPVA